MREMASYALRLGLICCLAGGLLRFVRSVTEPQKIERERVDKEAVRGALFPVPEGGTIAMQRIGDQEISLVKDREGRSVGCVFEAQNKGYSSVIKLLAGMKMDGTLTAIRVLDQKETPGLGTQMVEVPSEQTLWMALRGEKAEGLTEPPFQAQFKGAHVTEVGLKSAGGTLDAISGATLSSRAVVDAVADQGRKVLKVLNEEERRSR